MLATQIEVSDGTLSSINVGIEFFEQDDISVALDRADPLTEGVDYAWSAATVVTFMNTANTPGGLVPNGVEVLLRRKSKEDELYNIYDGGAPFSRHTLDENFSQLLYLSQEFSEGLGFDGLRNNLNMNGYKITNLGDPETPEGAVNVQYLEAQMDNTLRTPENIQVLPDVAGRASRLLGFNNVGQPVTVVPESGSAGDLALLLAGTTGADMIGTPDGTVQDILDRFGDPANPLYGAGMIARAGQVVPSIAALRALDQTANSKFAFVTGYYAQGDGGGGEYYLDAADTTSADNGGTVIIATDTARWKLLAKDRVTAEQFGAVGNGVVDDTPALGNFITALKAQPSLEGTLGAKTYIVSSALPVINVSGVRLTGTGIGGNGTLAVCTVLKATGTVGYNMLTVSSVAGQRKVTNVKIKGIAFDCNAIANMGLVWLSSDYGDVDIQTWNARVYGLYISSLSTPLLTDPTDSQRNKFRFMGRQTTFDATPLFVGGGTMGNASFNIFEMVGVQVALGVSPGIRLEGCDNNIYTDVSGFANGTYLIDIPGSSTPGLPATNSELIMRLSGNKPMHLQNGGSLENPRMIRVVEYDISNSTPPAQADLGTSVFDPIWRSYVPTLAFAGGGGSFSGVNAQYRRVSGQLVEFKILFTVVSAGTGAVDIPLPTNRPGISPDVMHGQEIATTGDAVSCNIGAGSAIAKAQYYSGSALGAGATVVITGAYQTHYTAVTQ